MIIQLPLFPLNLVAFPGEKLNLHIFEPRYKQLINECFDASQEFGIPPVRDNEPMAIGTSMLITEISQVYPDGKMDIKTEGIQAFKLIDYYSKMNDKLYPGGEVEMIEDDNTSDIVLAGRVINLIKELYALMKMKNEVPELTNEFRIGSIVHKVGLNYNQEIELLYLNSEVQRLEYVEKHLLRLIPIVGQMEELRKKIQMNGHFKNVIPPNLKGDEPINYDD